MLRKLLGAGIIIAVMTGAAVAQLPMGLSFGHDEKKKLTPDEQAQQDATDHAYKSTLQKDSREENCRSLGQHSRRVADGGCSNRQEQAAIISPRCPHRRRTRGGDYNDVIAQTWYTCPPCGRGEMVDARDLKSLGSNFPCRFKSGRPHQPSPPMSSRRTDGSGEWPLDWFRKRRAHDKARQQVPHQSKPPSVRPVGRQ